MTLELHFQPAAEGDAVWVRWNGGHQMLVDMGREWSGTAVRARIEALPPERRHFDLLVVTHVDADHIGGVLTGLVEAGPLDGLGFDDIWFNGWAHINGRPVPRPGNEAALEAMGPAQGERFTEWLTTKPWNEAFDRGPVERSDPLCRVELPGGVALTVLGPPRLRFTALRPIWADEVRRAFAKGTLTAASPGIESMGQRPGRPELKSWHDVDALAAPTKPDTAPANGTSITLLLEWAGRRVLLTGDAFAPDVLEGLRRLGEPLPVPLDVVKLPHHGSDANFSDELADAIRCPTWVFSTNGARYYHPGAPAIARLLRKKRQPRPELVFNQCSEFTGWWSNPDWKRDFAYTTETGSDRDGVTISLEAR